MEFYIKHENLVDFPYDPADSRHQSLFAFDEDKVQNLSSEILFASPTCYLVSGYRGAGKTSFIQRVKEVCVKKHKDLGFKAILFVYSSFSRFESKTFFLRKIIRDLQDTIVQDGSNLDSPTQKQLKDLYYRTFNDVKREWSQSQETELSKEVSLDISEFLKKLFQAVFPIILPPILDIFLIPFLSALNWTGLPAAKFLVYAVFVGLAIIRTLKFTAKYTLKTTNTAKITGTSISDDNITEYQLERILTEFIREKYKLVFVLDELDKIEQAELDLLLKEMKPWLVRGKVDFILVAGQRLTMQYYQLRDGDDELLASLFSKVVHVNQLTEPQLVRIFKDYLFIGAEGEAGTDFLSLDELDEKRKSLAYDVCISFIYRSKCVPRTFMNLLRQELRWENGKACLDVRNADFEMEKLKMSVLRRIFGPLELNADIPETVRGHLVMQLFRVAIFITKANRGIVAAQELRDYIIDPNTYPYLAIMPLVRDHIDLFYNEALAAGLIGPTADLPKAAIPESAEGVQEFVTDFLDFMDIAWRISGQLYTGMMDGHQNQDSLGKILTRLVQDQAITFAPIDSQLLDKPLDFYRTRKNDYVLFREVKESMTGQHISFPFLFQQIFGYYTSRRLEKVFREIPDWVFGIFHRGEGQSADFSIRSNKLGLRILVNQRFINGAATVTSTEVDNAVNLLDDVNIQEGRGNYYVSIIFYRSNNSHDDEAATLAANLQIQKVRPDFKDKVRFIILSIYQFQQLDTHLESLKSSVKPYTLTSNRHKSPSKKRPATKEKGVKEKEIQLDPDDTQKGRWGGNSEANGRKLSATVSPDPEEEGWYYVNLKVVSTDPTNPLGGRVTFHLHEEFSPDKITVLAKDGVAELSDLGSYEAFTVGATCDNNTTQLELDLNTLPRLPKGFKYLVQ